MDKHCLSMLSLMIKNFKVFWQEPTPFGDQAHARRCTLSIAFTRRLLPDFEQLRFPVLCNWQEYFLNLFYSETSVVYYSPMVIND